MAPTMSVARGPMLTDMGDELVNAVLSYFHFYERPKYRLVCRRLMITVDAMPPPQPYQARVSRFDSKRRKTRKSNQ